MQEEKQERLKKALYVLEVVKWADSPYANTLEALQDAPGSKNSE